MATPLIVGHQLMGDQSTDFQEICTKSDGSKLGHRNGNDQLVHVYGSCWIYDHEQIGKECESHRRASFRLPQTKRGLRPSADYLAHPVATQTG
jgi:hypothetical protein